MNPKMSLRCRLALARSLAMGTIRQSGVRPATGWRETLNILGLLVALRIGVVLLLGAVYMVGTVLHVGPDCSSDDSSGSGED